MSEFKVFRDAVDKNYAAMAKGELFVVSAPGDDVWDLYLSSFPEGTNPMFRERTEHDCSCCKNYVRNIGNLVSIKGDEMVSVWDNIKTGTFYDVVAAELSAFVKQHAITNVFKTTERSYGASSTEEAGTGILWNHFFARIPSSMVVPGARIGSVVGHENTNQSMVKRALTEITDDAVGTVLELISQNSLYRGNDYKRAVTSFKKLQGEFKKAKSKDLFCWTNRSNEASRIRNTAIGTLLVDLSENRDLDQAVRAFEAMVAPTNYKRTTALVTPSMVKSAKEKIRSLGLEDALERRYAVSTDLTINNVLFADRDVKADLDSFDELMSEAASKPKKNFGKVEEVSVEKFIQDILPTAKGLEVLFENGMVNNLMSLIAPQNASSDNLFKWNNNFSWSYNGEVTDSIKERVKNAGGNVTGYMRVSMSWDNRDDMDLHVYKDKDHLYFANKRAFGAYLDVDANAGTIVPDPVENVFWKNKQDMVPGNYTVKVNNFNRRSKDNQGVDVEFDVNGEVYQYHIPTNSTQEVFSFIIDKDRNVVLKNAAVGKSTKTQNVWSIDTNTFHKVEMVMNSPNFWDGQEIGNKHLFFILKGCNNNKETRGFYNEFLKNELHEHRKVFELLADKMKTAKSDNQLSGLGFSVTQRAEVTIKVTGANVNRVIKVKF